MPRGDAVSRAVSAYVWRRRWRSRPSSLLLGLGLLLFASPLASGPSQNPKKMLTRRQFWIHELQNLYFMIYKACDITAPIEQASLT